MSVMVCGHGREALIWALGVLGEAPNRVAAVEAMAIDTRTNKGPRAVALVAAVDPAKLAAIITELMKHHGIQYERELDAPSLPCFTYHNITDGMWISMWTGRLDKASVHRKCTMPQARVFALRLLNAATTTAQDIERMIGEVTP